MNDSGIWNPPWPQEFQGEDYGSEEIYEISPSKKMDELASHDGPHLWLSALGEAEEGGSETQSQSGLYNKFEASLDYVRPCVIIPKKQRPGVVVYTFNSCT